MPLPCPSGTISLLDIQTEFGGSNPIGINEYYGVASGVPSSGQISFSDFFCKVAEVVVAITNAENLDVSTLFSSAIWKSTTTNKKLIVNGTVGATSVYNYALRIPSTFGAKFTLVNRGQIYGAGGVPKSGRGGDGGNAIFAGKSNIFIQNNGRIYAGGGSGGQGGTGGAGVYQTTTTSYYSYEQSLGGSGTYRNLNPPYNVMCNNACVNKFGSGAYCKPNCYKIWGMEGGCGCTCFSWEQGRVADCTCCYKTVSGSTTTTNTYYTSGGAGGLGGRGQGYEGANASGSTGSAGGTNAGTGGTGGTGGTWGSTGNTGDTGFNGNNGAGLTGWVGGDAGYYIVNNSNVTWLETGTRLGRVG